MESETQFLREKLQILRVFMSFARYKINLGTLELLYMYLGMHKQLCEYFIDIYIFDMHVFHCFV